MGTVDPFMGANLLLTGFVIIVLAGLGSLHGAMICGLLVGVIETVIVGTVSASMKEAVLFIILFAALVFRPQGLFATWCGAGLVISKGSASFLKKRSKKLFDRR